ncbi:MAG: hypothetical protein FD180_1234 [Planctomycetota bacterium]|nr:MAG: hypothetical protein FD180_1234 [Planctomycetota bacterium]
MRKMTVICTLVLALCASMASAQMPDPTVSDMSMSMYDVGSLKAGDWVEYETEAYGQKYSTKYACVGVEGDVIWIEYSDAGLAMMHKGSVILVSVNKGDRKVTKAWFGKPGEKGKELKVSVTPKPAGDPPKSDMKMKGTGKVSKDKLKVKDKELDCEKLEMDIVSTMGGKDYPSKSTTWYCESLPFKYFQDEATKKNSDEMMKDVKWDGKPEGKGAVARQESGEGPAKSVMACVGCGTDAKATLQK